MIRIYSCETNSSDTTVDEGREHRIIIEFILLISISIISVKGKVIKLTRLLGFLTVQCRDIVVLYIFGKVNSSL